MPEISKFQSIGIIIIAASDKKATKALRNTDEYATAWLAVFDVWNSLTYENALVWEPAKLF